MQDLNNPFAAPQTSNLRKDLSAHNLPLAGRGTRLGAAMIDGLAMMLLFTGPYLYVLFQTYPGMFNPASAQPAQPGILFNIGVSVASILCFILLHGYLLATAGKTIGKSLLSIRIVRTDGSKATFGRLIGLRYAPFWAIALVPFVGPFIVSFVDPLLIFGESRKCLHDLFADTIVVEE